MLRSFEIENFRCFDKLSCKDSFDRVNLILGANNAGKTALLEALFLYHGYFNARIPLAINIIRGVKKSNATFVDLFGWLFHDKRVDVPIVLAGRGGQDASGTLAISLPTQKASTENPLFDTGKETPKAILSTTRETVPRELQLRYLPSDGGAEKIARVYVPPGGGLKFEDSELRNEPSVIILSRSMVFSEDDAERLEQLIRKKKKREVIKSAQLLEPRLEDLALSSGGKSALGDIGLPEMIPVEYMGEGFNRFLGIVLAGLAVPRGVLLVDEIEAGLHHSILKKVWKALARLAKEQNVQVFATTHSWECIKAAHDAFCEEDSYDLRVIRLDRVKDKIKAKQLDREKMEVVVGAEMEVR